ncbi:MAG TPA: hypothetical protein VIY48_10990 [Candidatus Paceibacterota bacterium]
MKDKKPLVVQLVDHESAAEFFNVPNGLFTGEVKAFEADMRRNALADGEKPPIYAGVVSISRHYGGPEEGGWYYDWYQVEEILQCQDFRHLLSTVRSLRNDYPSCPRGRGSVIGGDDTVVYISRSKKLIEDMQSEERPTWA